MLIFGCFCTVGLYMEKSDTMISSDMMIMIQISLLAELLLEVLNSSYHNTSKVHTLAASF